MFVLRACICCACLLVVTGNVLALRGWGGRFLPPATSSLVPPHLPAACQRNQDATVYCGNLDENVTDELLWELMIQVCCGGGACGWGASGQCRGQRCAGCGQLTSPPPPLSLLGLSVCYLVQSQVGPVSSVHMPKDKVTGRHQGYGFVEFKGEEDADYAIKVGGGGSRGNPCGACPSRLPAFARRAHPCTLRSVSV